MFRRSRRPLLIALFATTRLETTFSFLLLNPISERIFVLPPTTTTATTTRLKMSSSTLMESISLACTKSLARPTNMKPTSGGGASGGGGASTSAIVDTLMDTRYFLKSATGRSAADMLKAEYLGVKAMSETETIRVPTPVAFGTHDSGGGRGVVSFVVFEYLEFGGGGSEVELGRSLAKMHRHTSPNDQFGFIVDNTIGATPQPNLPYHKTWPDFWDEHRLGHMLKLTGNAGLTSQKAATLRQTTRDLLSHNPPPSLIHGDLWGGNKGYAKGGGGEDEGMVPVIFDPATYYGDREADVAMTYLFGGFGADFYRGYEEEWPLPDGHEKRRTVYNLYHILNHDVLFGGFYLRQAQGMIDEILAY